MINGYIDRENLEVLVEDIVGENLSYSASKALYDYLSKFNKPFNLGLFIAYIDYFDLKKDYDCEDLFAQYGLDVDNINKDEIEKMEKEWNRKLLIGSDFAMVVLKEDYYGLYWE